MGEKKRVNLIALLMIIALVGASIWWLFFRQPFDKNIKLGLDLQSGTHLLLGLQPDVAWTGTADELKSAKESLATIQAKKVSKEITQPLEVAHLKLSDQGLLTQKEQASLEKAIARLGNVKEASPWQEIRSKLKLKEITPDDLQKVKEVLVRRTNEFGTSEPIIQTFGKDHIIVDLPTVTDPRKAEAIVSKQAFLEFKELTPKGVEFFERSSSVPSPDDATLWRTVMTGAGLKEAHEAPHGGSASAGSNYVVDFTLTKEGGKTFGEVTSRNVGKPIAIYLDGKMISSPNVRQPITDGSGVIESFTLDQAHELARFLKAGALPIPIKVEESVTVGPTLGHEALIKSLSAGILGLVMVMIFMLVFYRLPGVFANMALLIYALWLLAVMTLFNFVLTLPGIAGVVLSIGMAVDANVLIFERLKEELWNGRSIPTAVETGFQRAWSSILDSHVTVIVGAVALIWKGSSSIQGFGWALLLGTVLSLITAWGVTRVIMDWAVLNGITSSRKAYGA